MHEVRSFCQEENISGKGQLKLAPHLLQSTPRRLLFGGAFALSLAAGCDAPADARFDHEPARVIWTAFCHRHVTGRFAQTRLTELLEGCFRIASPAFW
jgi:hypothetical protein